MHQIISTNIANNFWAIRGEFVGKVGEKQFNSWAGYGQTYDFPSLTNCHRWRSLSHRSTAAGFKGGPTVASHRK